MTERTFLKLAAGASLLALGLGAAAVFVTVHFLGKVW